MVVVVVAVVVVVVDAAAAAADDDDDDDDVLNCSSSSVHQCLNSLHSTCAPVIRSRHITVQRSHFVLMTMSCDKCCD